MLFPLLKNATLGVTVGLVLLVLACATARASTDPADTVDLFLLTLHGTTGTDTLRIVSVHLGEVVVFFALCALAGTVVGTGVGSLRRVSLSSARKDHIDTGA